MDMVNVRPKTAAKLREIAANNLDVCPAYVADCGTGYRIIHLRGIAGLPAYYQQFEGAVIEWLPGAEEEDATAVFLRTEEEFGALFANIDIIATKV